MSTDTIVMDSLEEMKEKFGELDDIKSRVRKMGAKIEDIQMVEVDDVRDAAKSAKDAKEATERLEASLEGLSEKVRDEVRNVIDTAPDVQRQKQTQPEEWLDMTKMSQEDFAPYGTDRPAQLHGQREGTVFRTSFLSPYEMQKAAGAAATNVLDPSGPSSTDTSNLQGGVTTDVKVWNKAIVGDPWVGAGAFQMPLNAGSFKTLEASGIAFDSTAVGPANTAFDATNVSGKVQESSHAAKTHTMRVLVSHNQEDDVAGITAYLLMMIQMAYGKSRGALTSAALQAKAGDANEQTSGVATALPTTANTFARLMLLASKGDMPDYWPAGPSFMLNPAGYTNMLQGVADKGGFSMSPNHAIGNLAGWDVHLDTQAEAVAANAHPIFFGAWRMAVLQAQVGRLTVDRYMATVPGAMAIYAQFRFLPVVCNPKAYSAMKVAAD